MKTIIYNYVFDKVAKTVTFSDFQDININDIAIITNDTRKIIIFNSTNINKRGSVTGNVLTLAYDTSAMANTDSLIIEFDYVGTINVDDDHIPVETNTHTGDLEVIVASKGHECLDNSSSATLGISGIFTGDWQDTLDYSEVIVSIGSDKASAINGLQVLWSADGIVVNGDDLFTIYANKDKTFTFPCQRRHVKIIYTNGGEAQGIFNLSTLLKRYASKGSSHNIKDSIVADDDAQLVKSVLTAQGSDGVFRNIPSDLGGNLRVNSFPYAYAIAEGDIAGHDALLKFGTRTAILAGVTSVIWEGTAATKAYITTPGVLSIVSSSTDDSSSGVGIRTLTIHGLDSNWEEYSETITMDGTSAVLTTGSFQRVFRAYGATCGTSLTNVGAINVTRAGVQVLNIVVGDGQTLMASWTVPFGKVAYITSLSASSDSNKGARVSLFTRVNDGGTLYPWRIRYRAYLFSGSEFYPFQIPFSVDAKTDIEIRFLTPGSAGVTSGGATFELWYEDV